MRRSGNIRRRRHGSYWNRLRVDAFPQQPVNDQSIGIQRATAAAYPGLGMIQIAPTAGGISFGTAPLIDVVVQGGTSSASGHAFDTKRQTCAAHGGGGPLQSQPV